jgi:hypothetical protein
MSATSKLAALAAGFAILLAPMAGAAAETRVHHRHIAKRTQYRPVRVASESGWRHRIGKGWDNTCHNIPYLPNMYACDAK